MNEKRFNMIVDDEFHAQLKQHAAEAGVTMSEYTKDILSKAMSLKKRVTLVTNPRVVSADAEIDDKLKEMRGLAAEMSDNGNSQA